MLLIILRFRKTFHNKGRLLQFRILWVRKVPQSSHPQVAKLQTSLVDERNKRQAHFTTASSFCFPELPKRVDKMLAEWLVCTCAGDERQLLLGPQELPTFGIHIPNSAVVLYTSNRPQTDVGIYLDPQSSFRNTRFTNAHTIRS